MNIFCRRCICKQFCQPDFTRRFDKYERNPQRIFLLLQTKGCLQNLKAPPGYYSVSKTLASGESLSKKSVVFPFPRLFLAASS